MTEKNDHAPQHKLDWLAFIEAFGSILQVFTGAAAIYVAYLAYNTSLDFRSRDEQKDELLITPFVSVIITESTSIDFVNQGLGPAVIKELFIRSDDKLKYVTDSKILVKDADDLNSIGKELLIYTFKPNLLNDFAKKNKIHYKFSTSGNIPLSGEIIAKDSRFVFSGSNAKDLLNNKRVDINSREFLISRINFGEKSHNLGICYCSFTDKSCYLSSLRGGVTHNKVKNCFDARSYFNKI